MIVEMVIGLNYGLNYINMMVPIGVLTIIPWYLLLRHFCLFTSGDYLNQQY